MFKFWRCMKAFLFGLAVCLLHLTHWMLPWFPAQYIFFSFICSTFLIFNFALQSQKHVASSSLLGYKLDNFSQTLASKLGKIFLFAHRNKCWWSFAAKRLGVPVILSYSHTNKEQLFQAFLEKEIAALLKSKLAVKWWRMWSPDELCGPEVKGGALLDVGLKENIFL